MHDAQHVLRGAFWPEEWRDILFERYAGSDEDEYTLTGEPGFSPKNLLARRTCDLDHRTYFDSLDSAKS